MKYLPFLGSEFLPGTLKANLSIFTATPSYYSALAGWEQNNAEIKGMQALNNAMLNISQGYNYYDNWYLNQTEHPDIAEYYQGNFS